MVGIDAVFCDNEGCVIPGKGLPFPLMPLDALRTVIREKYKLRFAFCTGRSIPYVEAMVQLLGLVQSEVPCVCEGGAALYWPNRDEWELTAPSPSSDDLLRSVEGLPYRVEPGKVGCLSLYPNSPASVGDLFRAFENSHNRRDYNITQSVAAVDITRVGVDKKYGLMAACNNINLDPSNILCIGDAENDIPMLRYAGYSACPSNAVKKVKALVDYVSDLSATEGVIDILQHFERLLTR